MTIVQREGGWAEKGEVWTPGKDDSEDFKFFKFSSYIYKQKIYSEMPDFWREHKGVPFSFVSSMYTRQEYFPDKYMRKDEKSYI